MQTAKYFKPASIPSTSHVSFIIRVYKYLWSKTFFMYSFWFDSLLSHIRTSSHLAQFYPAWVKHSVINPTRQVCRSVYSCSVSIFHQFFLVSFTITWVDAAAHHVCFPFNHFVFDMHAQSLFLLPPQRECMRWLSRLQSTSSDKLTATAWDWTQRHQLSSQISCLLGKPHFCIHL